MAVTILTAGDLHLGRRSKNLPAGALEEVGSPIQTWRRFVDEAIGRGVDLICLTGDIVDESNKYFEAFGPLIEGLRRLDEHEISTFLVAGNHDYDVLTELIDQVDLPGVHLLGRNGTWESVTFEHQERSLSIAGWSFPSRHVHRNPLIDFPGAGGGDHLTLGLLHCDLDGTDSTYAPVARTDLESTGIDCWLLGHIHKPVRYRDAAPILYTGSPHALDRSEQGPHGPWLLSIDSADRIEAEHLPLSPVRYDVLTADVSSVETRAEWRTSVVSAVQDHVESLGEDLRETGLLMCEITLEGTTTAYEALGRWIETADTEVFSYETAGTTARIYRIRNQARPAVGDLEDLAIQQNPAGYLARVIRAIEQDEDSELVDELTERLRPVFRRIDTSSTYAPLRRQLPLDRSSGAVREQLLRRSRELLAALLEHKDQPA